jgi:hypothetical protein
MMNDRAEQAAIQAATLDDWLRRYHAWAKGYSPVPTCSADPMFRNAKAGRGYDTTDEIIDDELTGSTLEAIDFHISELPDIPQTQPYRSAIYCLARNLHAGQSAWGHPRLPTDPLKRGAIVVEARIMLTKRLMQAGVM